MDASEPIIAPILLLGVILVIAAFAFALYRSCIPFTKFHSDLFEVRELFHEICECVYRYIASSAAESTPENEQQFDYESCKGIWHDTLLGLEELEPGERVIALEMIHQVLTAYLEAQDGRVCFIDAGSFFLSLRRLTQDRRYPNSLTDAEAHTRAGIAVLSFKALLPHAYRLSRQLR